MILDTKEKSLNAEGSGVFPEMAFGIQEQDMTHIIMLLREKMYRYPIDAICREVASNSRDANREVGKDFIPIRIVVSDNPYLEGTCVNFEDDGPGISPDRMQEIFMNYGASTKRDTNTQTGGFGLGAKSPFAYAKSFTVETVFDGVRYIYMAAVKDGNRGRMILLHQEDDMTAGTGTRVTIPVERGDLQKFEDACVTYTCLWEPVPEYINFSYQDEVSQYKITAEECGVALVTEKKMFSSLDLIRGTRVGVLLDGIPYPLDDFDSTFSSFRSRMQKYLENGDGGNYMFFRCDPGEVSITPNRESLHYDEKTNGFLTNLLKNFVENLGAKLDSFKKYYKYPYSPLLIRGGFPSENVLENAFTKDFTAEKAEELQNLMGVYEAYHGKYRVMGERTASLLETVTFSMWGISVGDPTASGTVRIRSDIRKMHHLSDALRMLRDKDTNRAVVLMDLCSLSRPRNVHLLENHDGLAVMVMDNDIKGNTVKSQELLDALGVPYLQYSKVAKATKNPAVKGADTVKGARCVASWSVGNRQYISKALFTVDSNDPGHVRIHPDDGNEGVFPVGKALVHGVRHLGQLYTRDCRDKAEKVADINFVRGDQSPTLMVWINQTHMGMVSNLKLGGDLFREYSEEDLVIFSKLKDMHSFSDVHVVSLYAKLYKGMRVPHVDRILKRLEKYKQEVSLIPERYQQVCQPRVRSHGTGRFLEKALASIHEKMLKKYPLMRHARIFGFQQEADPAFEEYIEFINQKEVNND